MRDMVDTIESGGAMSAARFSFDGADQRARRDAARILGRLMRAADFAALRDDQSIITAFAETDLREARGRKPDEPRIPARDQRAEPQGPLAGREERQRRVSGEQ